MFPKIESSVYLQTLGRVLIRLNEANENFLRSYETPNNQEQLFQAAILNLEYEISAYIHINSGYRCRALNELVHGVPHSQHLTGEAADLYLPSVDTGRDWQRWIQQHCPHYDQVILERNRTGRWWLHVSARRQQHMNRHQVFMVVR